MAIGRAWTHVRLTDVQIPPPNPDFLPGSTVLSNLVAGLEYLVLLVLVAVMVWSGAEWAGGQLGQNPYHVSSGKVRLLVSAGAALLVGSAAAIINFFFHIGGQIR